MEKKTRNVSPADSRILIVGAFGGAVLSLGKQWFTYLRLSVFIRGIFLFQRMFRGTFVLVESHPYQLLSRRVGLDANNLSCQCLQVSEQLAGCNGDDKVSV